MCIIIETAAEFVAWCSAFTNMYIGAFVMRTTYMDFVISKYGLVGQFILFIFCEHLTIGLKILLDKFSSKIPEDIEIQKERQRFIVDTMTDDARFVRWSNQKEKEIVEKLEKADTESKTQRGRSTNKDEPRKGSKNRRSVTRKPSLPPSFKKRRYSKEPHSFEVEKRA